MPSLFQIPNRGNKESDNQLAKKSKVKKPVVKAVRNNLMDSINMIKENVEKNLGKYKDNYEIITDTNRLAEYFQKCDDNELISIDTETTGLDPIEDKIVGLCIYTPGEKAAYIPINHVSYITGTRIENQLTEDQVGNCMNKYLFRDIDVIMFNAKFDIRVMRNQLKVYLNCTWDCYLAARLMNENEPSTSLKALHQKYVLEDAEDEFSYESIFHGLTFDKMPIDPGYLYAAHDAIITYELYQFQKQYLYYDENKVNSDRNGMNGVSWVFENIEMPCVNVMCDMEDTGVAFDTNYAHELSVKYQALLNDKLQSFYDEIGKYTTEIETFRRTSKNAFKLENPINIGSATQISILLYDILKIEPPDPKQPRGTGVHILAQIDNPICKAILDYREVAKLLSTYIDKLPNVVHSDGRIHCNFNQYGADTGRMSSSDPNLQNIPSHNKEIRKMFVASPGYVLMSSDYSQQEPKCLAALCRAQGDSQMYDTFMAGKDLYSEIASKAFNVPYEDCLEFNPDGTTNKEGKARRTQAKSILLGVLYGRGTASIGEQLHCSTEMAQQIKDSVFRGFPAIKKFEEDSLDMAYDLGYVTTVCGRKRRLPDLQLPEFEFKWKDGISHSTDLLDFDEELSDEVPEDRVNYYLRKLSRVRFGQKRKVFEEANAEGIWIVDNGAKIADATRQCVNARIQGSAADLTKVAMIELNNNEELKKLGFRLLIPVHDEVIAECPENNMREVKDLLAKTMSHAAEEILQMPIKCDVEVTKEWYGSPYDGEEAKVKELTTSHSLDVENIRMMKNG